MKTRRPFKFRKVLVPVDFSEPSRRALDFAIAFVKPFDAEILLLHVVETVLPPPDGMIVELGTLAVRLNEDAARQLSEWRKEVASDAKVKEMLRPGVPHIEIVEAADETNADLIILGTHGRRGLARLLIGSTAERVVRHAHCPVLVVRERQHPARSDQSIKSRSSKPKRAGTRRQHSRLVSISD